MHNHQEQLYSIALTKLPSLSLTNAFSLVKAAGSATEVFANRKDIAKIIPDANEKLTLALENVDDALRRAEQEIEFAISKRIRVLTINDKDYPQRMLQCDDAPLVLYYYGNAELNRTHVINIIGTRKCTEYGREICNNFVSELKKALPDTLIVSGLAYGIDVEAHKAALNNGMDTVGVLAHGLDTIYPAPHRQTAACMVQNGGGLITEYTSHTTPERINFVRRNRIVAGISDACIVVESAYKGGSLITAQMALDYNREVMAFPGRVYDDNSAGCNNLIKNHAANLITNAEDFINMMGWESHTNKKTAVQQSLFPEFTADEQLIINALNGNEDKHINQLMSETGLTHSAISTILFQLEMNNIVKALGGARYHLCRG